VAIVVRDPSLDDFKQINDLGRWFQENSNFRNCGWSDGKAYGFVKGGTSPSSDTFMLIAEEDGELVGFFLGNVVEYFFSDEKIAQELVLVFKPDRRKGIFRAISKMITGFCLWAESKDAVEVAAGITSGIAGEGYKKLLERHGFNEVGVLLKKEV
jgi:hypothetical protein